MSATNPHIELHCFSTDFRQSVETLVALLRKERNIVRVVAFSKVQNAADYTAKITFLQHQLHATFGQCTPLSVLVAQEPYGCQLAVEVHLLDTPLSYHPNYITTADGESLFATVRSASPHASILEQARDTFLQLKTIFSDTRFPLSSIVRQWNYIERITEQESNEQHYQQFNNARTEFYATAEWPKGYPAATGIGTSHGGVIIDLNATRDKNVTPINNPLQIAAHAYSSNVLVGSNDQNETSPKFERAKLVGNTLYLSGTAAIRGEQTITGDIIEQTRITIDNIQLLMRQASVERLSHIRVYLKNLSHAPQVQQLLNDHLPAASALFVMADVCRPELLIEIEGVRQTTRINH